MTQPNNELSKYGIFTKNRVEAFSDGIFAIIVTLLILELKVPHIEQTDSATALMTSLMDLFPKFLSWVISFLTICVIWINHHRIFETFKGFNIVLFWLNVQVLLWVCFIPFPTALVGDYPHNPLAVASYGIVMALTSASLVIVRCYGLLNTSLLEAGVPQAAYKKAIVFAFIFGPILYLVGAALALLNTFLSLTVYLLITLYFISSFKLHGHRKGQ
jgi:uncharacterized membrane protein